MGQIREYPPPSTPRAVKINLPFHIFRQVYNWVIGLFLWTRLAISRPLGERSEPCLASKRPTASDEVARGPTKDFWQVYLWTCWYFMYFVLHHGIASKCLNQFDENCIDQSESFLPQSVRHMLDCLRLVKKEDILEESWLICYIVVFEFGMTGGYSGRKLFVGGLPPKVDDKALHDVFSRFWHIEEGLYSIG